jgi:hypothetical protein
MIVFAFLGLVFLVLGIGFALATLVPGSFGLPLDGEALLTFGILALTFVPIGLVFSAVGLVAAAGARRERRLARIGLPGHALVHSATDTGVTVNGNPRVRLDLEVQVPGRSPYRLTRSVTVPRLAVGAVTPGGSLPVRVDPEQPESLSVDWSRAGAPLVASQTGMTGSAAPGIMPARGLTGGTREVPEGILDPQLRERVNAVLAGLQPGAAGRVDIPDGGGTVTVEPPVTLDLRGVSAEPIDPSVPAGRATVQGFVDTGVDAPGGRLYTFDLEIRLPERPAYTVKHAAVLDSGAAARLFRGASFPVRVDPADQRQLTVDWDGI